MKTPPANLLEPWPSDGEATPLPDHPRAKSLFPRYRQEAGVALTRVAAGEHQLLSSMCAQQGPGVDVEGR